MSAGSCKRKNGVNRGRGSVLGQDARLRVRRSCVGSVSLFFHSPKHSFVCRDMLLSSGNNILIQHYKYGPLPPDKPSHSCRKHVIGPANLPNVNPIDYSVWELSSTFMVYKNRIRNMAHIGEVSLGYWQARHPQDTINSALASSILVSA